MDARILAAQRILLVRLSHLGDVVHALPVFHALRRAAPRARIAWAVQPEFAPLLQGVPGLERTIPYERRGGWRAWRALRIELARFAPELAVDAQGNWKSAAVCALSGASTRLGLARADWRESSASWLCNARSAAAAGPHALDRMQALVDRIAHGGAPAARAADPRALDFELGLSASELEQGERDCESRLPRATGAPLIVQLGAAGDPRSWPRERVREFAALAAQAQLPLLLLSGPQERELGAALQAELGTHALLTHWVGQAGLRALAAFLRAAAQRGARLACADSGPAHLAAASGLPVIALAGPQDARRTGPWPLAPLGPHRVLRARVQPSCAPCLARDCTHALGPVCMSELEPSALLDAALDAASVAALVRAPAAT